MRKRYGKKILAGILTATMVSTFFTGCGKSSSDTISIGASFPQTGTIAPDGKTCLDAIKLAVKEANDGGGINGKKIELVTEDDEGAPTSAAAIGNKFADNDDIMGVIHSYNSSCALAQVDIYDDAGIPNLSPVATTPQLTGSSDYFYRTAPNDSFVGESAATFMQEQGIKKVALFYENDDYGLGIAEAFEEKCKEIGLDIVTTQTFVYGETVDFSTQLTATSGSGADAIFIGGCVTEIGLINEQKSDYGCGDLFVLGGNGAYAPALLDYGKAVEEIYVQGEFDVNVSDKAKKFVEAFEAEYDYEPGNWAASAYDSACILIEAMKNVDGEITRDKINEQIKEITYEGVCGTYHFDNCDSSKAELILQIKDGAFTLVE